ncbi:MAG: biotin-dependent carboxyltransferase family protein [Pyrinomonadaceae bacterium]
MSITFQKSGILTTLQDLGRFGYRRFGVNPNGAMDESAARLVNILIGNPDTSGNEAVLEMHFPAPQIVFEANAVIAIGGASLSPDLDDEPIENWRPYFAKKGSQLKFQNKTNGNRAYLAVHGGFKLHRWLESASTNLAAKIGGLDGRKLAVGDRLSFNIEVNTPPDLARARVSISLLPSYSRFPTVRVIAGAEFGLLSEKSQQEILTHDFTISTNSDRMGFRLQGQPIALSRPYELVSAAVSFGTVQLLPDGQLIVLMADHQTSGGYPRIAHVISRDLPLVAQLGANDKVAFHMISLDEAEQLALEFENELNFFRVGCRFQTRSWNI